MNDLQSLHAALAEPDPCQDVIDHSRHRLQNRINGGPGPRRHTRWLAVGTGITVTAAAAAVAIAVLPGGQPAGTDNPTVSADNAAPTKTVTAQQVLLAAATAAAKAPEGSGEYWHVKVTIVRADGPVDPADTWDYWTGRDGRTWFGGLKTDGKAMPGIGEPRQYPFDMYGAGLTLEQLRALPTEPEALKTWIIEAIRNGDGRSSAGPLRDTPELLAEAQFDSLFMLVSTLPAPPEVRAAAFRAIATFPDVQSLGEVPGGQGLLLPGGQRFVVDTATGQVTGASRFVTPEGAIYSVDETGSAEITTEWTDTLPS
ncbi:CU044_5270 family protein [Actinophytocola sp.]|uniref:CU044_5270 family protein n=1 Tax=Actinophytocola sp. TaxID=1872138 RepID=UPI002ED05D74